MKKTTPNMRIKEMSLQKWCAACSCATNGGRKIFICSSTHTYIYINAYIYIYVLKKIYFSYSIKPALTSGHDSGKCHLTLREAEAYGCEYLAGKKNKVLSFLLPLRIK